MTGAFHGRTFGALSVTADPHYRDPFGPLLADVTFVNADDPDALRAAVDEDVAAVVIEAIQGEGGVRPMSAPVAAAAAEACADSGALLIADEVQCGLGRTGRPFHAHTLGLTPDLMAVGKALGAGVPIGAALASEKVASAVAPGDHGSTYGGNALACRAALTFLGELTDRGLMAHVAEVGRAFEARLREVASRRASVSEVRGAGLMWGMEIAGSPDAAAAAVDAARQRGLLINRTAGRVLRFLPPYTITTGELDEAIDVLDGVLAGVVEGAIA
jgi:acetylornithine aminotransferase/acetylornithine/N-succinyldiaminopimelate aminotransferase